MPSFAAAFDRSNKGFGIKDGIKNLISHTERVKAVVIGSGFGGSIAAYRLSEKGIDTIVLERGKRWDPQPNKDVFSTTKQLDGRALWLNDGSDLMTYRTKPKEPFEKYVGLVGCEHHDGITVWTSSGVGGGSLVYNTCLLKPTEQNFYKCFSKEISYEEMNSEFYPEVVKIMNAGPIPDDILDSEPYLNARIFGELSRKAGVPINRINTATNWHTVREELLGKRQASAIEGDIWYGANSGYKNSLDKNYLKYAEESGYVKVQELSNVLEIEEINSKFHITYSNIDVHGNELIQKKIIADMLFMGAGSMGSTSLLIKCKAKGTLPKLATNLGKEWGNNGDTFGVMRVGKPIGSDKGGPAHLVARDYEENPLGPQTCIAFPDHTAPADAFVLLGMSIPGTSGYWDYNEDEHKAILHWPNSDEKAEMERMKFTMTKFAEALEDKNLVKTALDSIQIAAGATAHPCGGVAMGSSSDFFGRVHGYEGLYVTDGAFIPRGAAACNPSLTIAAFAERSMKNILENDL